MSVYRRVTDLQKIMVRSQDYLQLWNGKKTAKDTGRRTWTCVNLDESETLMTFFMTHDPQWIPLGGKSSFRIMSWHVLTTGVTGHRVFEVLHARPGTCFRLVDSFDSFDSFHSYPAVTKNGDKTSVSRQCSDGFVDLGISWWILGVILCWTDGF